MKKRNNKYFLLFIIYNYFRNWMGRNYNYILLSKLIRLFSYCYSWII